MNLWVSMWTKPRKSIRRILENDPTRNVHLLAVIAGVSAALDRASSNDAGDAFSIPTIF